MRNNQGFWGRIAQQFRQAMVGIKGRDSCQEFYSRSPDIQQSTILESGMPTFDVDLNDNWTSLEDEATRIRTELVKWIIDKLTIAPQDKVVINFQKVPSELTEELGKLLLRKLEEQILYGPNNGNGLPEGVTNIWSHIDLEPVTRLSIWNVIEEFKPNEVPYLSLDF